MREKASMAAKKRAVHATALLLPAVKKSDIVM